MNTEDYQNTWRECPQMRPMYVMTKDVERGGKVHTKGTVLYGLDYQNTFVVPNEGNIGLPLSVVRFTGYGDVNQIFRNTFNR